MAEKVPAQRDDEGTLSYGGQTWRVTSSPEVVDSDGDDVLVEVWVRRGEGDGKSREG